MNDSPQNNAFFRQFRRASALFLVLLLVALAFWSPGITAAQVAAQVTSTPGASTCAQLLPALQKNLSTGCSTLDRDQVCYGNAPLSIDYQASTTQSSFAQPGDITPLNIIRSITAGPLNLERSEWGLAVLKVQANLPGTTAGQLVTFVIYGDTNLTNTTPPLSDSATAQPETACGGTITRSTYLRGGPTTSGAQVQLLQTNTTVNVIGRLANRSWVLVETQGVVGWVTASSVKLDCVMESITTIAPDQGATLPGFSTFYFSTGTGAQSECKDIPSGGLLVQSPTGKKVSFKANGADISVASSVVLRAAAKGLMTISVLEGVVTVKVGTRTITARTGQEITVPLGGANGLEASGPPTGPRLIIQAPLIVPSLCELAKAAGLTVPCQVAFRPTFTPRPRTQVPRATTAGPTPMPGSTATPQTGGAPNCTFTVQRFNADQNPAPYDPGQGAYCTTMRWDVEGVESVFFNGQGVVGHGSQSVCIQQPTNFTLTMQCGGQSKSVGYTLGVSGGPTATPTDYVIGKVIR
jgi:hypothetical protein